MSQDRNKKRKSELNLEIERYLNSLNNNFSNWKIKVLNPYHRFRTWLGNLSQYNVLEQNPVLALNPYQMLSGWLLDITVNGLLLSVMVNSFLGWKGVHNLYLIPALGISWYLVIDFIKEVRKAVKGE